MYGIIHRWAKCVSWWKVWPEQPVSRLKQDTGTLVPNSPSVIAREYSSQIPRTPELGHWDFSCTVISEGLTSTCILYYPVVKFTLPSSRRRGGQLDQAVWGCTGVTDKRCAE